MLNFESIVCPLDKVDALRRIDASQPKYYAGMVREFIIPGGPDGLEVVLIDTRHDDDLRECGLIGD